MPIKIAIRPTLVRVQRTPDGKHEVAIDPARYGDEHVLHTGLTQEQALLYAEGVMDGITLAQSMLKVARQVGRNEKAR